MSKFAKGKFVMTCPEKYVGTKVPTYRSSWEWQFMKFCDTNPSVQKWASEAIQIPYKDPLTGRQTVYVPDFLVVYIDNKLQRHAELWEIKPASQTLKEKVGKNPYNQAQFIKNQAKWASANIWCKQQGIKFRILNENDIYSQV